MSAFLESLTEDQRLIHEALCESHYLAGLTQGWNCGDAGSSEKFASIKKSRRGHLRGVIAARQRIEAATNPTSSPSGTD